MAGSEASHSVESHAQGRLGVSVQGQINPIQCSRKSSGCKHLASTGSPGHEWLRWMLALV
jgi:hypothetical protein